MSLLERHLQMLETAGVTDVVLALGFQPESVQAELTRIDWPHKVETVLNPRFDLGSVLTVHTVADALTRGGDVLLMDADVLYDERILSALVAGESVNRLLIDRDFEAGDEPVKLCLKDGVPVELRKQLAVNLEYDTIGESVGFFRFREETARRFTQIVAGYVDSGRANMQRAVAFYEALGFPLKFGGPREAFTSFAFGSSYLNLIADARAPVNWWGRVIIYVSDVDAFYAGAVAAGLQPSFAPSDAPWGERYFHITDPDGHELSFARPLP